MLVLTKLRALRTGYPLTVRELAAKSGVSPDTVRRLEGGDREARPYTARKVADALGVEVRELAGPRPPVPPKSIRKLENYLNPEVRAKRLEKARKDRERRERKRRESLKEVTERAKRHSVWGSLLEEERNKGEGHE